MATLFEDLNRIEKEDKILWLDKKQNIVAKVVYRDMGERYVEYYEDSKIKMSWYESNPFYYYLFTPDTVERIRIENPNHFITFFT